MAEADPLRKYVEAGIAFTQLTKARAEAIVRELVKAGDVHREQAQDSVEELLDRSRKSTEGIAWLVRREIEKQLSSMGFATRDEVDKLEARIDGRLAAMAAAGAPAAKPSKAGPPKKAATTAKAAPKAAATAASTTVAGVKKAPSTPPPGTAARKATTSSSRRKAAEPRGRA